jgi:hypothetical protein
MGVVEVDDELAAGDPAAPRLGVHPLRRRLHAVDRALEEARGERVVDVGRDRDVHLARGDAGLDRLRLVRTRLGGSRHDGGTRQRAHDRNDRDDVPNPHPNPPGRSCIETRF